MITKHPSLRRTTCFDGDEEVVMAYQYIQYQTEAAVGVLTLKRPDCLNAINFAMCDEIRHFFKEQYSDEQVRVIVITGDGNGFCSGLDINDPAIMSPEGGYSPEKAYRLQKRFSDLILFMRRCPQPIIAAVNGAAAGLGLSMVLASDIRMAVPKSKFSAAYINLGVGGADMGSSWLFPRIVGVGNAARYLFTGDLFDAEEAHRMGLVQTIVEDANLMAEAMNMANTVASKSPLGLKLTKEALDINIGARNLEEAIRLEDRNQALCISQLLSPSQGK
jgi:enoyl-CoA hydratase